MAEWLLVETLSDLRHRARDGASTYERIGIASIVRRTLSDKTDSGGPVIHKARARLGLPAPIFEYTPMRIEDEKDEPGWKTRLSFARLALAAPSQTGGLDEFLAAAAAYHKGSYVAVNQVNRYFAFVHGGVHLGEPRDEFSEEVQHLASAMPEIATGWSNTLSAIAIITSRAIEPLVTAIEADPLPRPLP